jgi:hypothetical protein
VREDRACTMNETIEEHSGVYQSTSDELRSSGWIKI